MYGLKEAQGALQKIRGGSFSSGMSIYRLRFHSSLFMFEGLHSVPSVSFLILPDRERAKECWQIWGGLWIVSSLYSAAGTTELCEEVPHLMEAACSIHGCATGRYKNSKGIFLFPSTRGRVTFRCSLQAFFMYPSKSR